MKIRLALFWYLYLAGWGIFFPYYSLYLSQDLGLPESQVGLVWAVIPLVGLFAQPLWGQLADRTGSRSRVLAGLAGGTALTAFFLGEISTFPAIAVMTACFALFATSVLPMSNAVTLASFGRAGADHFGSIRMWGTLGFLTMVLAFPRWLDWLRERSSGPPPGLGPMFSATAGLMLLAALWALFLPKAESLGLRAARGEARRLLGHPPVWRILLFVFAAHLFLQGSINFFPLYVRERGGDVAMVSQMWIFMLPLEIPLIGFSSRTLRRLGARGLLALGLFAEGSRWTVCAFSADWRLISLMQLMHGVGVAGVLLGASFYIERAAPEQLRSTAQSWISMVSFGGGAIVSNIAFGWLFERFGPGVPYGAAGLGALALALLAHRFLPEPRLACEAR